MICGVGNLHGCLLMGVWVVGLGGAGTVSHMGGRSRLPM